MSDPVNHPPHYASSKIEVIEAIEAWGLGFHLGNAVKYAARAGKKDPSKEVEDLQKAGWYLKRWIEFKQSEKEGREPVRPNDMIVTKIIEGATKPPYFEMEKRIDSMAELTAAVGKVGALQKKIEKTPTEDLIKNAHRHIVDLCSRKKEFSMSVPPQEYDSDMVLQAPLDRLEMAEKALELCGVLYDLSKGFYRDTLTLRPLK